MSQKFASKTGPRRDNFQNLIRDRDETESIGTFSLDTETLVLHWQEWSLQKKMVIGCLLARKTTLIQKDPVITNALIFGVIINPLLLLSITCCLVNLEHQQQVMRFSL